MDYGSMQLFLFSHILHRKFILQETSTDSEHITKHITNDGRSLKIQVLIDEYSHRYLALHVTKQILNNDVIDILAEVMVTYGFPAYLRSDNRPKMVARNLVRWLA